MTDHVRRMIDARSTRRRHATKVSRHRARAAPDSGLGVRGGPDRPALVHHRRAHDHLVGRPHFGHGRRGQRHSEIPGGKVQRHHRDEGRVALGRGRQAALHVLGRVSGGVLHLDRHGRLVPQGRLPQHPARHDRDLRAAALRLPEPAGAAGVGREPGAGDHRRVHEHPARGALPAPLRRHPDHAPGLAGEGRHQPGRAGPQGAGVGPRRRACRPGRADGSRHLLLVGRPLRLGRDGNGHVRLPRRRLQRQRPA